MRGASPDLGVGTSPTVVDPPEGWHPRPRSRIWLYAIVAGLVVISAAAGAYLLTGGFHRSDAPAPSNEILGEVGIQTTIDAGQYLGITFSADSNATVSGTFWTTYNISAYLMTSGEYAGLVKSGNGTIPGYVWTSGHVTSGAIDQSLPPGSWVLAFLNSNPAQATELLFTSNIVLAPS
jgi:hypothetical protein